MPSQNRNCQFANYLNIHPTHYMGLWLVVIIVFENNLMTRQVMSLARSIFCKIKCEE